MNNVREDLKAYVDGELDSLTAARVEKALAEDASLRAEADQLKAISLVLREELKQPQPVGFEKTMEALRRPATPWWMSPKAALVGGAATLVFCAVVLGPMLGPGRATDQTAGSSIAMSSDAAEPMVAKEAGADVAVGAPMMEMAPADAARRQAPAGAAEAMGVAPSSTPMVGAPGGGVPPLGAPPLVIRNGSVSLRVDDVGGAMERSAALARGLGGFATDSNRSVQPGELQVGSITLRVPERRFDEAMSQIRRLGEVTNESTTGQDVTAQVADVEARLKVLRAEEASTLEILKATRRVGEILAVRERLNQVRQEIESMDAQRKTLRDQAQYSTIQAAFTQRPKAGETKPPADWASETWASALNALSAAGRFLGQAGIYALVFSPLWAPFFLVAWWLRRRSR